MWLQDVSWLLFLISLSGIFLNRRNLLMVLLALELILLGVNIHLVSYGLYLSDIWGEVSALIVLTVAAAESAISLALLVTYYRSRGTLSIRALHLLQG